MGPFDHRDYVELTMHFRCNLKCEHCMIGETMDRLIPESDDDFQQLLNHNRIEKQWRGLILTGSEITLRSDLPQLARRARTDGGFEHVRIQTHGMRLSNYEYCDELIQAGVDQFFVSLTAADALTHDRITKTPGSFDKTLRGLENLDRFSNIVTLTNTVITRHSYRQLPDIVSLLAPLRNLVQMDFWSYFPMSEVDDKHLLVSHLDVLPFLRQAILRARDAGRAIEVKNFPECLLADVPGVLDNGQPQLFIDSAFWDEFQRNGFYQCVHRDQCNAKTCLGLNSAYIDRFGWHAEQLCPLSIEPVQVETVQIETPTDSLQTDSFAEAGQ